MPNADKNIHRVKDTFYQKKGKRMLDLIFSLVLIILFFPLFLIIAFLVSIDVGWPIIFQQTRPGSNGIPFIIYKFRTMKNLLDDQGNLMNDENRLTFFGKFLRSTSLDELPEVFNILKGDMSFVGPRPLLIEYLSRYSKEQNRRHGVKPGITGWAQVHGRNLISWEEKFKLDLWYVDHINFSLDMKIVWKTIFKIFCREGISAPGRTTMEKFEGSHKK